MSSPITGFTQDQRLISIRTPLGDDTLLLAGLTGHEAISSPFHFSLELLSTRDKSITFTDLIGKAVTITILSADGEPRYVNGIVSAFSQAGVDEFFVTYRAEVVPKLALLTQRTNFLIFQNKSVDQVIEAVLKDAGIADYTLKLSGTYAPLDYCVQYHESDFAFVSRLMEEYGIFYYFEHDKTAHTLVLADQASVHQPCPLQSQATYQTTTGGALDEDVVTGWELRQEFRSGKYSLTDYNFETPSTKLDATESTTVHGVNNSSFERYDYPGRYAKRADGTALARVRMETEESGHVQAIGSSTCRGFVTGYRFTLSEHYRADNNVDWVLTEITHSASAGSYAPNRQVGEGQHYGNQFMCIPLNVPYRPERRTPKPAAYGVQSAVVVGKSGEEIWVDKYGRVKVQFFWDRKGKTDESSSCWVRVAQPWAGKNWGFVALPRMGQEVTVAFLDGDPDRPLIVGSVYNAEQMPPYTLPANQTQSGIKSRSSKGGGTDNFNELRFEDKKGSEEVHVQAEKDLTTLVKNDETRQVMHDRTTTIKNNETRTVKEGKDAVTVEKGDQTLDVNQGKQVINIKMGDQELTLGQGAQTITLQQGNQSTKLSMGNQTIELSMGNQSTKVSLGQVSTEAMQGIELKVGHNSIKIDQMGVTIQGMMIKIEGQIQTEVKGMMMQVSGDAMLMAKGGITMIN